MIKRFVFIFLFTSLFLNQAQAVIFPYGADIVDLSKEQEVKNPVPDSLRFVAISPFKEEVVKEALTLWELKHLEVLNYLKVLKIFYQLNAVQIASLLNERQLLLGQNSDFKKINAEDLKQLYETENTQKFIDFINKNQLSSKQILIFLLPLLRESASVKQVFGFAESKNQLSVFSLPFLADSLAKEDKIIKILSSVSFEINTVLKAEDLISLFLDFHAVSDEMGKMTAGKNLNHFLSSLPHRKEWLKILEEVNSSLDALNKKELVEILQKPNSKLISLSENEEQDIKSDNLNIPDLEKLILLKSSELKEFLAKEQASLNDSEDQNNYFNPDISIGSLAHLALAQKQTRLAQFIYENENFQPNILNHIGQTPLHSLFSRYNFLNQKELQIKDWESLFSIISSDPKVDWNAKDIHGLSPLAVAILNDFSSVVPILLDIKEFDVTVKDNYNRSLVILTSQSSLNNKKTIIKSLVEKGGLKLVTPSHFNDYIDGELNPITIEQLHPVRNLIFHAFSVVREKYTEEKRIEEDLLPSFASLIEQDYKIKQSLRVRNSLSENITESNNPYYQQPVIQAIRKDDVAFFEKFYKENSDIKNFVEQVFLFPFKQFFQSGYRFSRSGDIKYIPPSSGDIEYIPSYNLLLMAIKENSPQVVEFFVENIENPDIFKPDKPDLPFFYMDPLSESLIQSYIISETPYNEMAETEVNNSRRIVDTLISHKKIDIDFENFMGLTPMELAFLTGQIKKVQALELKGVDLPKGKLWDTEVDHLDIIQRQGFHKLLEYALVKNSTNSSCYNVIKGRDKPN